MKTFGMTHSWAAMIALMFSVSIQSVAGAPGEASASSGGDSAQDFLCFDSTQVSIHILSEPLPSDSTLLQSFLWDMFITGPESEGFDCPVSGWKMRAESHARMLIRKATADSLDWIALEACLARVLANTGRNAYLPISASYVNYRGFPAWAILVRWEWADSSPREVLGHARVYVLDARGARQLAFATCS
jgi:hypothetical protein